MHHVFSLVLIFIASSHQKALANFNDLNTCKEIENLGYPVEGYCEASENQIKNVNSENPVIEASVCFGGFGDTEQSYQAVAVQYKLDNGESINYTMEMPRGRANRKSVNDYTYYGTWKKGVFFEDQTTLKEDGKFWKAFSRKGVVINYLDNEIELVETYKPAWGKLRILIDSYLTCEGTLR